MSAADFKANVVKDGIPQPASTVTVKDINGALIPAGELFSDAALTIPFAANPFTTDAQGNMNFFIEAQTVSITAQKGAFIKEWKNVVLNELIDPDEFAKTADLGDIAGDNKTSPSAVVFDNGNLDPSDFALASNFDSVGGSININGNVISGLQVTIADNGVADITFPSGRVGGFLSIVAAAVGNSLPQLSQFTVLVPADFGSSPTFRTPIYVGSAVTLVSSGGIPTGTTGVDGELTIHAGGTTDHFYIENRTGNRTFSVTLI